MIIQSAARDRSNDISFTIARSDLKKAVPIVEKARHKLGGKGILVDERIAKIAVVGVGMRSNPGVAATMFKTLAREKINIEMISTSEIRVSCVVKEQECNRAVKVLHRVFGLDKPKKI